MEAISAKELDRYAGRPGYRIFDLRSREEYVKGHIRGALNAPEGNFGAWLSGEERKDVLILYCDRGAMSMSVARTLDEEGWRTKTVIGGIRDYRGKNLVRGVSGRMRENAGSGKSEWESHA